MSNIVFACVKQGDKYTSEQVNILFDMVARNIVGVPFNFVCFTDDATGLNENISIQPTPSDIEGWWAKLYLFAGHFTPEQRVVYLDLSCVVVGSIAFLSEYDGAFATLRDFYRPNGLQSAIMMWKGDWGKHIWDSWNEQGRPHLPGEIEGDVDAEAGLLRRRVDQARERRPVDDQEVGRHGRRETPATR